MTPLENAVAAGKDLNAEIQALLPKVIAESKHVIFNGDNYTEEWHAEAEKRGLPNRRSTIDSLPDLISPKSIALFGKYGVFSEREIHSRFEILLENYKKTINIESQITIQMANRQILPAAMRYQSQVAQSIANLKAAGARVPDGQTSLLNELSQTIEELQIPHRRPGQGVRRARRRRYPVARQAFARRRHPRDERRPRRGR